MRGEPRSGRVLVIDDEVELMEALCESLREEGFETAGFASANAGLTALKDGEFDLLLSDLMMPGTDGIQLLRSALAIDPNLVGVIMTGQGSIQTAVEAMKAGAFDYILKPFRLQQVLPVLDRVMEVRRLRLENVRLRRVVKELTYESPRYRIVGESLAIKKVLLLVEKVAATEATVLIRGASGTGKELIARALHGNSARRDKPLVAINCATLQEQLLESELFGHERGSFTGAEKAKAGLFEAAEGGTLFIDEVAEMSPALQAKFLRVLEEGRYRRVGGTKELRADVRIVAATNKPLEDEQKSGRFREDLYFRLNVITVMLPSLRERADDIPLLVEHFLKSRQLGRSPMEVSPEVMALLKGYEWPGNIRELANVLERAQILADGNTITADDLPENFVRENTGKFEMAEATVPVGPDDLEGVERRHVLEVLRRHDLNKVLAAKALGISRRSLYRLLDKYKLTGSTSASTSESTDEPS